MEIYFKRKGVISAITTPVKLVRSKLVNKRLNIDQFATAKKLLNPCGFPMNDIMAFENVQSDSVARSILQRIPILKDSGLTEDGKSIDEHFADLCPANWSSPAEYMAYQRKVAENYYSRVKKLSEKAAKEAAAKNETISFESINE